MKISPVLSLPGRLQTFLHICENLSKYINAIAQFKTRLFSYLFTLDSSTYRQ